MTSQLRPSPELLEHILGEDLLALRIEHLTLDENLTAATTRVPQGEGSRDGSALPD